MASKKYKLIITAVILSITCAILYQCRDKFNFNEVKISGLDSVKKKDDPNPLRNNKVVITDIHMGIGNDTSVGIQLACPYSSSKQYSQLWENSKRIKSDFLLTVGSRQMNEWARERNYGAVKATFLDIVNKYVDEPVKDVYLSRFFVE